MIKVPRFFLSALVFAALFSPSFLSAETLTLENSYLRRSWDTKDSSLKTTALENKLAGLKSVLGDSDEFRIRIAEKPEIEGGRQILTARDFTLSGFERKLGGKETVVEFQLTHSLMDVKLTVSLENDVPWLRKKLTIQPHTDFALEVIEPDVLALEGVTQPYTIRQIHARGHKEWRTGLGQPLYGMKDATYWGVEFPAATNKVKAGVLHCAYYFGSTLKKGEVYESHSSIMGVGDNPEFIQESFFEYIDATRARPFHLQVQYNSWFDFKREVTKEKFLNSVNTIHKELVEKRGVPPLSSYVIDDGWEDVEGPWTERVWPANEKFQDNFDDIVKAMPHPDSHLGIWLSPGVMFGAGTKVKALREEGYEALLPSVSMAGPKYMTALGNRMEELVKAGVSFFKLDGIFGHLNARTFDLKGAAYGVQEMPWLNTEGFRPHDPKLNDSKYDELKIFYLSAGTERLTEIFDRLGKLNPRLHIVASNGAWLSPWWLQYVDSVWMINADDGAGSDRMGQLVYRDSIIHDIVATEHTQFPLNAIFNHDPRKTKSGESPDVFRPYLYMVMSRGTGFLEYYLKPTVLRDQDWDVVAEGILWSHATGAAFKRSVMHGGAPGKNEVYGYTGWTKDQGYISVYNPGEESTTYKITLDRKAGLISGSGSFLVSSPLKEWEKGLPKSAKEGDTIELKLEPKGVRIINFSKEPMDWSQIRKLHN